MENFFTVILKGLFAQSQNIQENLISKHSHICIFRNCIYFLNGFNNLLYFQENPLKYIQEFSYSSNPLKIIVFGPPFCGKTNLIERISSEFNLKIIDSENTFLTNGWIHEGLPSTENFNPDIILKIQTETIQVFKTKMLKVLRNQIL